MNQEEMWNQYGSFIIGKAKEVHRMFPKTLELNEKISIAWMLANSSCKSYDPEKSSFKTYAGVAIMRGLFKAVKKESIHKNTYVELDLIPKNEMLLDEKVNSFESLSKSEGGYFVWLNKVYGYTLDDIAKLSGYSRSKICGAIKKFQNSF